MCPTFDCLLPNMRLLGLQLIPQTAFAYQSALYLFRVRRRSTPFPHIRSEGFNSLVHVDTDNTSKSQPRSNMTTSSEHIVKQQQQRHFGNNVESIMATNRTLATASAATTMTAAATQSSKTTIASTGTLQQNSMSINYNSNHHWDQTVGAITGKKRKKKTRLVLAAQ